MKAFFSLIVCILLTTSVAAQPWLKNLPTQRSKAKLTFYDHQQAFYSYWEPFNVDNCYYMEDGIKKKAPGWKQFKRWEWEMLSKIDKQTGAFPVRSSIEIYNEFIQQRSDTRTSSTSEWTVMGPNSSESGYAGIGRLNCIEFHPDDLNTYWVGAAAGGLWVTTDDGLSWTCLTDYNSVLGVSDIIIPSDFATSNTIYIATGDRDAWDTRSIGVLKSKDGGQSWDQTGLSFTIYDGAMTNRLLLDPQDNQTIIAATSSGVFRTRNGGDTWDEQLTDIEFIDMEYRPGNFDILYGSTKYGHIYYSDNAGASWHQSYQEGESGRIELAVSPAQPGWVYALVTGNDSGLRGIYKSENNGVSYDLVFDRSTSNLLTWAADGNGGGGQGWYDLSLAASPIDANILTLGGVNTWRSDDGGVAWHIVSHWHGQTVPAVHADKHQQKFRSNGDLFECNDGGVYISSNTGLDWTDKTNGIIISQMYRLGVSQTEKADVITGLQDNGTKLHSVDRWDDVLGGDGMDCMIDYSNVNVQYGSSQLGNINRTDDHWESSHGIRPFESGNGAWVTPIIMDPADPNVIYAGYQDIFKSFDKGESWQRISEFGSFNTIQQMGIAPSDNQTLYVSDYNTIRRTINGGGLWDIVTNNLPTDNGSIESIAVKNDDPNTVWVALSGYSVAGVYESTNGGDSWTNISEGLPLIPAYSVVQNKSSVVATELYVGTDVGVFYKNGTLDWEPFNNGLPNVRIGEIDIYYAPDPAESRLRAASYGRGLWDTPITFTPSPMSLGSVTTRQASTEEVLPGDQNVAIVKVELVMNGNLSPLSAASFTFTTNGSTDALKDIEHAKLYYTGRVNAFSDTNQFGFTIISPDGEFIITDVQELVNGKNYFWLTYDLKATAILGHVLDATCTSVNVDAEYIPITTDPNGHRPILVAYCDAGANDSSFEFIENITIGNFSHTSSVPNNGFSDFTNYTIRLEQESISELAITNGQPFQSDAILVWIDWNFDGDFNDESELVYDSGPSGENTFFATITVPAMASRGITRMRVRLHDTSDGPNYTPCGNSQWGEVEDYSILVKGPSPCRMLNYLSSQTESVAGTYVDLGNDGVAIPVSNQDNASSDPQEIGFEFEFQCKSFTQFILNTNGFIKLGATPPSADDLFFDESHGTNGGIYNSDQPADQHLLIPFNHDLGSGLGGADYRVHTSGIAPDRICTIQFKNVRDFTTDPLQIFDSIQFQVKLYETSNIIEFIYGDWASSASASFSKSAAVGLKGTGNSTNEILVAHKTGSDPWENIKFYDRNYTSEEGFNFGNLPNYPEPDAGRTLRFTPTYETDIQVGEIYALAEASFHYSSPQTISVSVRNIGHSELNQLPVMLNITGANSYTTTKNITSIDFRQNSVIHFNQFIPTATGFNTITLTVPDDDHSVDNTKSWTQHTTEFDVNYSSTEANSGQAGSLTSSEIYYARYHVTGSAGVSLVKTYFSMDGFSVGQEVFGIVLDENGNEVGRSNPYIVEAGDLGGWHTFTITNVPVITNGYFYAGFGAVHENMGYQLLGVQDENPTRQNTFFKSAVDGSNLQPYYSSSNSGRLMIGATLTAVAPVGGDASALSDVCVGHEAILSLSNYTGFIQWQQSPDGSNNWEPVTGGQGATIDTYTSIELDQNTYFRAEVSQPGFANVYSNVAEVLVLPTPDSAGIITGEDTVCVGDQGLVFKIDPIGNAISYTWTLSDGMTGSSTVDSIMLDFTQASNESTITVAGNNGLCDGPSSTFEINVNPIPSAPEISGIQPVIPCGDTLGRVLVKELPSGGWTLTVYPEDYEISGYGNDEFVGLPPGPHQLTVTSNRGCTSGLSEEFTIPNLRPVPDTPTITALANVLFSDSPVGNQWYRNLSPINGAVQQEFTATENGLYHTVVTNEFNCRSIKSNEITIIISAVDPIEADGSYMIFPNPASDELYIESKEQIANGTVELFNSIGHLVYSGDLNEARKIIRMTEFLPGVYLVKIGNEGIYMFAKVIKQ